MHSYVTNYWRIRMVWGVISEKSHLDPITSIIIRLSHWSLLNPISYPHVCWWNPPHIGTAIIARSTALAGLTGRPEKSGGEISTPPGPSVRQWIGKKGKIYRKAPSLMGKSMVSGVYFPLNQSIVTVIVMHFRKHSPPLGQRPWWTNG